MNTQTTSLERRHKAVLMLCEGAVMIALAEILSLISLFRLPQDGSVDLGMLPIFVFCMRWGFAQSFLVSLAHGILQVFLGNALSWGWQSILFDYVVAYTVLCVASLFRNLKGGFYLGVTVGCALRFLTHFLTGVTLWASGMPDTFFGLTMTSPALYSALYNGSYMVIDWIAILIVGYLLTLTPMKKYLHPYGKA